MSSLHQRTSARTISSNGRRLSFYAVIWNEETTVTDWAEPFKATMRYREVVRPGAFAERIASSEPVIATIDHDEARTFAAFPGTLLLQEDSKGLFCTCELDDSEHGTSVRSLVQEGKLSGASFRFPQVGNGEKWNKDGELPLRELLQVKLLDVALTGTPAYKQTRGEVHLRNQPDYSHLSRRYRLLKIKNSLLDIVTKQPEVK